MKIVAHRGASSLAADNSIKSIQLAIDCRVDVIEFDLQVTKDKQLVLSHDRKYIDTKGDSHDIAKSNCADLPEIVSLESAITYIYTRNAEIEIMLDCKGRGWSGILVKQLESLGPEQVDLSKCIVISFSLTELIKLKLKKSSMKTIYLWRNLPFIHIFLAFAFRQNGIGYPITADIVALPLKLIRKLGLEIYFYRVNTARFAKRAESLDVEYLGTDKPTIIVPAIKNINLNITIEV